VREQESGGVFDGTRSATSTRRTKAASPGHWTRTRAPASGLLSGNSHGTGAQNERDAKDQSFHCVPNPQMTKMRPVTIDLMQ